MSMMVQKHENEAIAEFVSVTQADPEVAKHILEAYAWNVDEAISFYLETGGVDVAVDHEGGVPERAAPAGLRRQAQSHPIDVPGDDVVRLDSDDDEGAVDMGEEHEDEDEVDDEQEEEEDIRTLASFRSRRATASHPVNYHEDSDDDMDMEDAYGEEEERFKYGRRERRGHRRSLRRVQQTQQAENVGQVPQDLLDLPDVNIEEQKMLLAAMTGEAYEGDLPDFSHHGYSVQRELSPSVIERQILREEQDKALQESLKRDKEKEIANEIAKIEEMEREESQKLEKRALEEDLQRKRERLPPEPEDNDGDSFVLVIRMPSGTRLKRRFSRRDDIRAAFDFIDLHASESDCLLPGTYHLVSQFPRKLYTSTSEGNFADGDFSHKQEALFVERTS